MSMGNKGTGKSKLNDNPVWSCDVMLKTCIFQTPRLVAQREFMSALIAVGKRLTSLPTKDLKSKLQYVTGLKLQLNGT